MPTLDTMEASYFCISFLFSKSKTRNRSRNYPTKSCTYTCASATFDQFHNNSSLLGKLPTPSPFLLFWELLQLRLEKLTVWNSQCSGRIFFSILPFNHHLLFGAKNNFFMKTRSKMSERNFFLILIHFCANFNDRSSAMERTTKKWTPRNTMQLPFFHLLYLAE